MRSAFPGAGTLRLNDVLPNARFHGGKDIHIASCCGDSRHIKEGDLFAALVGRSNDGHDFAMEAVSNGAQAVLSERLLPISVPTCIVEDTRQAYGKICHALVDNPCDDMIVTGITGTHGKTTTAMLLSSIIEAANHTVGIGSSLGYCDGTKVDEKVSEAPTAPEFARWMSNMRSNQCNFAVVEANSEGLARHSFAGMQLDAAIITNIRRAHLDLHGSLRAYREIKQRILSYLKPSGVAVINMDDPATRFIVKEITGPALTIGMQGNADVTATILEKHSSEQTFLITAGSESIPIQSKIIGSGHVYNCLAATAVSLVYGFDLATIARGIERVTSLPGRLERIEAGCPFATYVDAARTPDTLSAALHSVKQSTKGRVFCVFGADGHGNTEERPLLGRVVEKFADVGVITATSPGTEDQNQIAHDILDGYERPARAHMMPDRARAIGWALFQAEPGDSVLIAGRGDANQQVVDGQKIDFDDRQVARFFLHELGERRSFRNSA